MTYQIITGDCAKVLKTLEPESIDALVTDPPAGIAFMGKAWDCDKGGRRQWIAWLTDIMTDCYDLMKPGAYGLVWALPRTSHWTGTALEEARFEIRDVVTHLFGSGFPKSLDVSKAIDRAAGAQREFVGTSRYGDGHVQNSAESIGFGGCDPNVDTRAITAPATPAAEQWQGFGTALKPAAEFWFLVRKPLIGTVAANVLEHGTGALNIDGCRIGKGESVPGGGKSARGGESGVYSDGQAPASARPHTLGRWPSNVTLDEEAARMLDAQSGVLTSGALDRSKIKAPNKTYGKRPEHLTGTYIPDTGGASRFFYTAKASRSEREAGLDGRNTHPTVKPVSLMRWLCRLITPPGGVVLDPFCGSGSTGVACAKEELDFIGVELDPTHADTARQRIDHATGPLFAWAASR